VCKIELHADEIARFDFLAYLLGRQIDDQGATM
jgi:hypothetical protein